MQTPYWQRLPSLPDALFGLTLALVPCWFVGQCTRDVWWLTGLCFYIPSAFLAVVLLGFALCHGAARRRDASLLAAMLALPPLTFVLFVENRLVASPPPAHASETFRLVHWNVGGALHRQGMRDLLVALNADLYAFAEVPNAASVEAVRAALGSEFEAKVFGSLAVVGRGTVEVRGALLDRAHARVHSVIWKPAGQSVSLFVVDLPSSILVWREPLLREVNALVTQHQPDLVVGDFNAPRRSRALDDLPAGYEHAFHSVGRGLGYTWPVPVPVYALDHCLHSGRVVPARYRLHSSIHSDHRYQVLEFSL